jgi:fused signal recognition particle receptor
MIGFFKKGLGRTLDAIKSVAPKPQEKISKELLEEILLEADVDYELIEEILYYLPPQEMVKREDLKRVLSVYFQYEIPSETQSVPYVELILGVNGAGKTTTIGKLAHLYKTRGQSVMLGASDTFRAAAIEQLKQWAEKIQVPIIYTQQGHDPSAVAYDAISSAKSKRIERVIIDTAGRLQNQVNLVKELEKITRICNKAHEGAPHRKLLVIDGTQGNSAIAQAVAFHKLIGVDGIIITKLDGTAKGGALFGIARALELPIYYVGVGESEADLIPFDASAYIDGLLEGIFISEPADNG